VTMQRNWIGRSEGVEVDFRITDSDRKLRIFTTRQDTLYGATFMSVARKHPVIRELVKDAEIIRQIEALSDDPEEKQGVFTGCHAENPLTGESIPIYAANFVLMEYGTGAVMAVPAHDQRDFEFAKKYNIPMKVVIVEGSGDVSVNPWNPGTLESSNPKEAFEDYGVLVESGPYSGLTS